METQAVYEALPPPTAPQKQQKSRLEAAREGYTSMFGVTP
jgi:hypothetical protein